MDEIHEHQARNLEALRGEFGPRCRATPPGYDVKVYCDKPAGHHGRHECDAISWPS